MENITFVLGLKWRDKVNGNTYCRPVVFTDRNSALTMTWGYGYGNQYMEYAKTVAEINGLEWKDVPHTEKWVKKAELKNPTFY